MSDSAPPSGHPTLRLKLRRDVLRQWPQFVAVVLTVMLGVALFAASYDAYQNLRGSYAHVFGTQHFADLTISGGDTDVITDAARSTDGVTAVWKRTQADLPVAVGRHHLRGRVVGYPGTGQPWVNRVDLVHGTWLQGPDTVLVEQHMADRFGLGRGDVVAVSGATGTRTLRVTGVVSSAEYLWPARSRQEPITSPGDFGVLFVPERTAQSLAGLDGPNQTLVRLAPWARSRGAADALAHKAVFYGASEVLPRAEQPSNAVLSEEITGFREMSLAFPLLFLTAAALSTYVLLTRRVQNERPVIGMLRAAGMRRRTIAAHYLGFGVTAGLVGAVAGVLVGALGARALSHLYVAMTDLPAGSAQIAAFRPTTVLAGLAFGLLSGAVAALAPALLASRVPPAEAMRGSAPVGGGGLSWVERVVPPARRLPARWRMVLRGIGRNRRRTVFTAAGVALALVPVLSAWTMTDAMGSLLHTQFHVVAKQDARVDLARGSSGAADGSASATLAALRAVRGVSAVEPLVDQPAALVSGQRTYATSLQGLRPGTRMHGFRTSSGDTRTLPASGILVGKAVHDRLGVDRGDAVTLRLPALGVTRTVRVAGFVDEPLGTYAYASQGWLRAQVPRLGVNAALLRYGPGADRTAVRRAVSSVHGVADYTDSRALDRMWQKYAGLFSVAVGAMLVLGGLMAFAVLFTTMSVSIVERRREMATLRALGVRHRVLARLIAGENLLVTALGVVPGLVLGVVGGALLLRSFSSDQLHLSLVLRPAALVLPSAAVLLAAALSPWPGMRAVRRADIAEVVRERAG